MNAEKIKLYKFYADWCFPCKQQTKMLEENPVKAEVISINVDEDKQKTEDFGVRGLPTLILVDEFDNILKSWYKLTNSSEINEFIQKHFTNES